MELFASAVPANRGPKLKARAGIIMATASRRSDALRQREGKRKCGKWGMCISFAAIVRSDLVPHGHNCEQELWRSKMGKRQRSLLSGYAEKWLRLAIIKLFTWKRKQQSVPGTNVSLSFLQARKLLLLKS